jgi:cytochrome c553
VLCGYDRCIVSLQFHHVDPAAKSFPMSTASGKALDTYRAEAKKCVLVCANCHWEIETGMVASPPPGSKFADLADSYAHPRFDERTWRDLLETPSS